MHKGDDTKGVRSWKSAGDRLSSVTTPKGNKPKDKTHFMNILNNIKECLTTLHLMFKQNFN